MAALESTELFSRLGSQELRALKLAASEREFAAGEVVFRAGDAGAGVFVVKEGLVEISGLISSDKSRVFSEIKPGEVFGEMAVIERQPRSATATAVQPSVVYFIPRNEMLTLIEHSPGLAFGLLQLISHRLREFNQHYLRDVLQAERLAVLGRLARGIVHDLKNPLNIIGLTVQAMCLPNATNESRARSIERVTKQIERINDLVSEILLFTQGPRAGLMLAKLDYGQVMQAIFQELEPELNTRDCSLELDGQLPSVRLSIDPNRLHRVVINLTANAADATGAGGRITIRVGLDGGEVVTQVSDNGPGIAPEVADKLFEAFTTHGKVHGSGLGLSICRKIIEDHGGRIWAANAPEGGAVFSFTLPLPK